MEVSGVAAVREVVAVNEVGELSQVKGMLAVDRGGSKALAVEINL